jgi:hypothetical protein
MKVSLILAGAAVLATGSIAAAQSAGGAGAGGPSVGVGGAGGAADGSAGGATMARPGGGTLGSPAGRSMARSSGSVTAPGVVTGLNRASDRATEAGRPAPTTQAPLATGSDSLQPDSPASPQAPPPVGGSTPK